MKPFRSRFSPAVRRALAGALCVSLSCAPSLGAAEDIDIFTGASAGASANPRILIVLDNTSNWSRQSQQWPDGSSQGQSEARAISTVLGSLDSSINLGLMEFVTGGNANDDGGFIRHAVNPLDNANKTALQSKLSTISNNITSPDEKRNANTPYGNLMYDVYNYFSGGASYSPSAVLASKADVAGYTSAFSRFKSPVAADSSCGRTFVIFIGNPNSSGPSADSADNTARLTALNNQRDAGGNLVPVSQLGLPNFTTANTTQQTSVGVTSACYANATAAAAELPNFANTCANYSEGCSIGGAANPAAPIACPAGTLAYTVIQKVFTPASGSSSAGSPVVGTAVTSSGETTGYYNSSGAATSAIDAGDHGSLSCPATTSTTSNGNTATTTWSCSYAVGAAIGNNASTTSTAQTSACYKGVGTSNNYWNAASTSDFGGLTCPANSTCSYSGVWNANSDGCNGNANRKVTVTQTVTSGRKYVVTQTATPTTVNSSSTTTPASTVYNTLGKTSQCHASAPAQTSDYAASCTGTNISCTYNNAPTSNTVASCPAGTSVYSVVGTNQTMVDTPTGTTSVDSRPMNADEWARLMHDKGFPVQGSTIMPSVTTYTIDVYNKQPNATHTSLLMSMAKAGGGKYFAAKNEQAIVDALKQIMVEIQAVNSTFASTSLPVNTTNRTQNENQVFIGMFRPDPDGKPRWFGNLKRFQLRQNGASVLLADADGADAVNPNTGFITSCARTYWTSDSGTYWSGLGLNPSPAGSCVSATGSIWSDSPDGPLVEKGGAAQRVRRGNADGATGYTLNRNMLTESGGSLVAFSAASSGLSADLVNFIRGEDVNNERGLNLRTETRPSIHGDVIHSRPQPINYGAAGISVIYGANDGALHAIDAATGVERWAFVAPEFFTRLERLKNNSPLVNYPGVSATGITPTPQPRDYFFDGSIGLYQNRDNSKVLIYPAMRRGGRMIYALDVSAPNTPSLLWKLGCPNLADDTSCSTGMSEIGQTWSTPRPAFIKGYAPAAGVKTPVLIFGGGYDRCEDDNSVSPGCGTTKGNRVYIVNALTGELLRSFPTDRAVASDVMTTDIDSDGYADYAYAADVGGSLYRIDLVSAPVAPVALGKADWTSRKVAYTSGGGRKFLFAPALLSNKGKVYVAIGSGDREHPLESHYPYLNVTNRFYVYKDDLALGTGTAAVNLDADLQDYTTASTCDTEMVYPDSARKGWFMNLPHRGEQTVTSAVIASGMAVFSTNRPVPASSGTCATSLGEAAGYWVNLFNGAGAIGVDGACGGERRSIFVGGGLPPSPVMASSVPVGTSTDPKYVSVLFGAVNKDGVGANVSISPEPVRPAITSKRKRSYSYTKGE